MGRAWGLTAVLFTVLCTVAGQLLVKSQLRGMTDLPSGFAQWPRFLLRVMLSPTVLAGFGVAFIGALAYIAAISRLPITYAYPLASLSFPAVLLGGWLLFGEALTWPKALGSALIVLGVALSAASR